MTRSPFAWAQFPSSLTRIYGASDLRLPLPELPPHGTSDKAALAELTNYIAASKLTTLDGLKASGTISRVGDDATRPALLTFASPTSVILAITLDKGSLSLGTDGLVGTFVDAKSKTTYFSDEYANIGLLPLPKLFQATAPLLSSVADRGTLTVGGTTLHRITVVLLSDSTSLTIQTPLDLYFSIVDHSLVYSVASVFVLARDRSRSVLQMSYSGYSQDQGHWLPHTVTQTVNGQTQWTLSLSGYTL